MRLCALLVALHALPAHAASMLVWADAEDANAAAPLPESWTQVAHIFGEAGLVLADGYPKLLRSETVNGLKPGVYVLALGVCERDDAEARLALLKKLSRAPFAQPVTGEELACPSLARDASLGPVRHLASFKDRVLLGVDTVEAARSGATRFKRRWLHLVWADASRKRILQDVCLERDANQSDATDPQAGYRCAMRGPRRKGQTFVFERACLDRSAPCGSYMKETTITEVTVANDRLAETSKVDRAGYVECR